MLADFETSLLRRQTSSRVSSFPLRYLDDIEGRYFLPSGYSVYTYLIIAGLNKNNIYVKNYSGSVISRNVMTSLAMPKMDFILPWNLFSEISLALRLSRERLIAG